MSGCCFNQVESGPRTDLQLVERPAVHMGFIMGLGENQSGTIVFPLLLLDWNTFLLFMSSSLTHRDTQYVDTHTQGDDRFKLANFCKGKNRRALSCLNTKRSLSQ